MQPSAIRSGIRIASLDAWRGLAVLMVLGLHTALPGMTGPYPELQSQPLYRHVTLGNYGVQIFFVVSGLCVAQAALRALNQPNPLATFASARVRRIYPPYLLASVLGVLVSATAAYLVARNMLPSSSMASERLFARPPLDYACAALLLQRVCHVEPLSPIFWSLCYEAAFYVLVAAALLAAMRFRRDRLVFDLCHGMTLGCSLAVLAAPDAVPYPFDLWPEFGLGVVVLDALTLRRPLAYGMLLATVALQGAYAWVHFSSSYTFRVDTGMATIVALVFGLLLVALNPVDEKLARLLPVRVFAYVGVFSYSLYLFHWLVIGLVAQVINKLHLISAGTYWMSALAQSIVAIMVARLLYMVAERPFLSRRRLQIDLKATHAHGDAAVPAAS